MLAITACASFHVSVCVQFEEVQHAVATLYTSSSDRDKYMRNVVARLVAQRFEAQRAGADATLTSDGSPSYLDGAGSPASARSRSASGAAAATTAQVTVLTSASGGAVLQTSASWRST